MKNRYRSIIMAIWLIITAIFCISVLYDAFHVNVQIKWANEERTAVSGVDWFRNGKLIGGGYRVEGGYMVWSTSEQRYRHVSESTGWTPPPPPGEGEKTEPVTYEDVMELFNRLKNPSLETLVEIKEK